MTNLEMLGLTQRCIRSSNLQLARVHIVTGKLKFATPDVLPIRDYKFKII